MPVLRTRHTSNFTILPNEIADRRDMSLKAKGLLWYLLSKPDDWEFSFSSLYKYAGSDGKDSVKSGVTELEKLGYLSISEDGKNNGRFVGGIWTVSDTPMLENRNGKTAAEKPQRDSRSGKAATTNTKETSTEEPIPPIAPQGGHDDGEGGDSESALITEIVSYLNSTCGTRYRSTPESTRKPIRARLREGFTLEDFKRVIDDRRSRWATDPKMAKYLRPQTLFGTKFDWYLNCAEPGTYDAGTVDLSVYDQGVHEFIPIEEDTSWSS